ncbi:MAG: hypothetical protein LBI82_12895, partial [Dysgonamonadaceae bacterium]|nr:hypothetical protein [Dysgonamonadaceae bacterium]
MKLNIKIKYSIVVIAILFLIATFRGVDAKAQWEWDNTLPSEKSTYCSVSAPRAAPPGEEYGDGQKLGEGPVPMNDGIWILGGLVATYGIVRHIKL